MKTIIQYLAGISLAILGITWHATASDVSIVRDASSKPVISWTAEAPWTLQSSPVVEGPYADVTNSISPMTVTPVPGGKQFYRLSDGLGQFSRNAVGYVNQSLVVGLQILANPFNQLDGQYSLYGILPLPEEAIGTTLFRFDEERQAFGAPIQWAGIGLGWLSENVEQSWQILEPGEAFFLESLVPGTITWVGEVPQGDLTNPLWQQLSMRSSKAPREAGLAALDFPGVTGDTIWQFNTTDQALGLPIQYLDGLGWISATNPPIIHPDGPTIAVGTGFFLFGSNPLREWLQAFSVNP